VQVGEGPAPCVGLKHQHACSSSVWQYSVRIEIWLARDCLAGTSKKGSSCVASTNVTEWYTHLTTPRLNQCTLDTHMFVQQPKEDFLWVFYQGISVPCKCLCLAES
jgi:hypothetical protein